MTQTWESCKKKLKNQLSLQQFTIWINPLKLLYEKNNSIRLIAPNNAALEYINNNLKQIILDNLTKNINLNISVENNLTNQHHTTNLDKEFCFATLVKGDTNNLALLAAQQITNNIYASPYNPFIIYGNSGVGKTHLMQAIGNAVLAKNKNTKIVYMPLINFVKNITAGIRHNTIDKVKNYYQNADLLLVDDIHLISGKEKSQEEFFHIFNFLFNTKKQIVLTCDQIPKDIKQIENRLKTRFSQGLNLEIKPPELEMRMAILLNKAQNKKINLNLQESAALFVASHINTNVRDLEGALLRIKIFIESSYSYGTPVSVEIAKQAINDLIKPKKLNIDIADIQKQTTKQYGITIYELTSNSRKQHLVRARQTAIFLSHELTSLSLAKIGKQFGNRDHSTVLYSCEKFKKLIIKNNDIKQNYELIKLKLSTS